MNKASKLISEAILNIDVVAVIVDNKSYVIHPPTIYVMAGAFSCLSEMDFSNADTIQGLLMGAKDSEKLSEALSWFIKGDNSLKDELSKGTFTEVVDALGKAIELTSPQVFLKAATLTRSAMKMAAR
jgi:hypothetical protein